LIFASDLIAKTKKTLENMALQIIKTQNEFTVKGAINATTAKNFKLHFSTLLKSVKAVPVDLSKVTNIDADGIRCMEDLKYYADVFKRQFVLKLNNNQKELFIMTGIA
jgi:anti-anti-sigma regulatory factor